MAHRQYKNGQQPSPHQMRPNRHHLLHNHRYSSSTISAQQYERLSDEPPLLACLLCQMYRGYKQGLLISQAHRRPALPLPLPRPNQNHGLQSCWPDIAGAAIKSQNLAYAPIGQWLHQSAAYIQQGGLVQCRKTLSKSASAPHHRYALPAQLRQTRQTRLSGWHQYAHKLACQ